MQFSIIVVWWYLKIAQMRLLSTKYRWFSAIWWGIWKRLQLKLLFYLIVSRSGKYLSKPEWHALVWFDPFPEWHVLVKASLSGMYLSKPAQFLRLWPKQQWSLIYDLFITMPNNWQINSKFLLITKLFLSMTLFLFVLIYNSVKGIARGGWSGFGMVSNGSDPTSFGLYPTGIPPRVIVQICRDGVGKWQVSIWCASEVNTTAQHQNAVARGCFQPEHILDGYFMEGVCMWVFWFV